MNLQHKENCPNKHCMGGVIYTKGRLCKKCNPLPPKSKQDKTELKLQQLAEILKKTMLDTI